MKTHKVKPKPIKGWAVIVPSQNVINWLDGKYWIYRTREDARSVGNSWDMTVIPVTITPLVGRKGKKK